MAKFFIALLIITVSCRQVPKTYVNQLVAREIELPAAYQEMLAKHCQVAHTDSGNIFYYVSKDTLYERLLPSVLKAIYLPQCVSYTHIKLYKDRLVVLDGEHATVQLYRVNQSQQSAILIKTYSVQNIYDVNASHLMSAQPNAVFADENLIYLKFGKYFASTNFTGENIFYRLNYSPTAIAIKDSIFSYPKAIRNTERRDKMTFLYPGREHELICGFASDDHIERLDLNTGKVSVESYTPHSNFKEYDGNNNKDLGYIRFYDFTSERNIYQSFINNKFIILKRLQTNKLSETPPYDLYVLDENLKILSLSKVPFIVGEHIFPYENGIVITDNAGKFYYYEI